jgi:hypothetical protein
MAVTGRCTDIWVRIKLSIYRCKTVLICKKKYLHLSQVLTELYAVWYWPGQLIVGKIPDFQHIYQNEYIYREPKNILRI